MVHKPVPQGRDVGPEPEPGGHNPRVDAAVDLPTPVGQAFVLSPRIGLEYFDSVTFLQDSRVHTPVAQALE